MRPLARIFLAALLALGLASCGGGGVGSGGTGITVGGGVGSGGTGITGGGIGPITGFGSIFVNGVEYDIATATLALEDAATLQLGMTVAVTGSLSNDFTTGTATRVASAADLRGPLANLQVGAGSFEVLGTTVTTDAATVFDGVTGLGGLAAADPVQVYGLLEAPGTVRATRVEKLGAAALPVVSGTIAQLNTGTTRFNLGTLTIDYSGATLLGGLGTAQLADGLTVRVRAAAAPVAGVLQAAQLQTWNAVAQQANGAASSLAGVVTDYSSLGAFRLLGVAVDASSAQITGGLAAALGNGVKVEATGTVQNGVLVATKLQIRHVPGTGGPASFTLKGTIGAFVSPSSFRVTGNPVDASGGSVVFAGGTAGNLGNGVKVQIVGSQVVNGVLIADTVTFVP